MRAILFLALLVAAQAQGPEVLRLRATGRFRESRVGPQPVEATIPNNAPATGAVWAPVTAATALAAGADETPTATIAGNAQVDPAASASEAAPLFTTNKLAGTQKSGEFIVVFDEEVVKEPRAHVRNMQVSLASKLPSTGSTPDGASGAPLMPFSIVDASRAVAGADGYVFPVKTATIKVEDGVPREAVVQMLASEPGVTGVYPNTIYSITQACQANAAALSGFAPATSSLKWSNCLTTDTTLVWYGQRCGADLRRIQWTGVYAAYIKDQRAVPNCHVSIASPNYALGTSLGNSVFGACGVAPTNAPSLPTILCDPATPCINEADLARYNQQSAITINGCGLSTKSVAYSGTRCGPGNQYVRWSAFSLVSPTGQLACRQTPKGDSNPMYNREWFGNCGVPPYWLKSMPVRVCGGAAPNPPPPPPSGGGGDTGGSGSIPREALKSGERVLEGMNRIQANLGNRVPVYNPASGVVVAILDTGGTNLADLNVKTGISFVGGNSNNAWLDRQNHGTHVAGTIGAINNGAGVYGVMPGVKILPVKVLSDDGYGSMSDIMAAIDYVTTNAAALGVGVINLSLGGTGSASDPICKSISAAAARGIIVNVAAGNDNKNLQSFSPAACSAAVTVTAINPTNNQPASFSNWLDPNADDATRRRTITAPGVNIVSTLPDGTYQAYSGTSMATPHVSGVAARCFVSGECRLANGARNRDIFLNKVWDKYTADNSYRWTTTATPVSGNKYYGPLVWAAAW